MKNLIVLLSLVFSIHALAGENARISNEFATVKACDITAHSSWLKNFELGQVINASARDTGKSIEVILTFNTTIENGGKTVPAVCSSFTWLKYDGAPTNCDCETTNPNEVCSCAVGTCSYAGGEVTFR